ncbi:hypothetical protein SQ03_11140 [Methylobacterium platani JCM 14648]|uniref:Uncharacterized protein n=2 Tax=Methylobacterium platani TaxID=427683 RepID=A0A179S3H1_9HYPH|nr:hypothetical protein SQ03_11140 [Methylobacterium platani JCM 14648]OAS18935.1 hypothetical protein A5481_25355 [Methylobacterium platani]
MLEAFIEPNDLHLLFFVRYDFEGGMRLATQEPLTSTSAKRATGQARVIDIVLFQEFGVAAFCLWNVAGLRHDRECH